MLNEVQPPFLNGGYDIFGSETFDHLSQREPVAEPLALNVSYDRRRFQKGGYDVRTRPDKKHVPANGRSPTAWAPRLQIDDDETENEFPHASSTRPIPQE